MRHIPLCRTQLSFKKMYMQILGEAHDPSFHHLAMPLKENSVQGLKSDKIANIMLFLVTHGQVTLNSINKMNDESNP